MVMRYDNRGNPRGSWRSVRDRTDIPQLVGDGWEDVAYKELLRIQLTISSLHQQLEGEAGYEETGKAFEQIKAATDAFREAHRGTDRELI